MISFLYAVKCFSCGFAMCFPGLSGASTASLLGIYGDLLEIPFLFLRSPKRTAAKLAISLISLFSGIVLFYFVFSDAACTHPKAFLYAGSLITALGLPPYIKRSGLIGTRLTFPCMLYVSLGVLLPCSEKLLESCHINVGTSSSPLLLILCGVFLSVSLILPGISFSYMLSFLGLYGRLIADIKQNVFMPPLLLVLGITAGTLIFSSALSRFMKTHGKESDCFIIGFIVSALINSYI